MVRQKLNEISYSFCKSPNKHLLIIHTKHDVSQAPALYPVYFSFFHCYFCWSFYIPPAIYLAKKNIRKQGELMEYEKVRSVSMWLKDGEREWERESFCCSNGGIKGQCPHSSAFVFFRRDTVCCTRGSTTPGTLWWCKPESSSGRHGPTHTRPHTHSKHTRKLTVWFMFRASKQRRKADRIVLECQEQAYWLINRPPVCSLFTCNNII